MNRVLSAVAKFTRSILQEFLNQLVGICLLIAAWLVWHYSGYAAVSVLLIGAICWIAVASLVEIRLSKKGSSKGSGD